LNNKGIVLILVLVLVASCVAAVVVITSWVSRNCDWSQRVYTANKAGIYIHTALKAAAKLLEEDDNHYDSPDDNWAKLPPLPIKNGEVMVQIIPTNAKIDLNLFFTHNNSLKRRLKTAIADILVTHGVDEEVLNYMQAWVEKDVDYDEAYYLSHLPPYLPRKQPFYSLKEIDFIRAMANFSNLFHDYFTVDGSQRININFASKVVLQAYLPEIEPSIDDLLSYRQKHPFTNITQLRNVAGITDDIYLAVQPYITTESDKFAVRIVVNIDKYAYCATALIKRQGKRTQILKYFEGKGFYE